MIPLHTFSFTEDELAILIEATAQLAYKFLALEEDDPRCKSNGRKYEQAKRIWEMLQGEVK